MTPDELADWLERLAYSDEIPLLESASNLLSAAHYLREFEQLKDDYAALADDMERTVNDVHSQGS